MAGASILLFVYIVLGVAQARQEHVPQYKSSRDPVSEPSELEFVGRVGAKSYFSESNPPLRESWFEAIAYCEGYGLSLATVDTEKERDFLAEHLHGYGFNGYWVAARDSHTLKQLQWGKEYESGSEITVDMELSINPAVQQFQTCGAIFVSTESVFQFQLLDCGVNYIDMQALCETKNIGDGHFLGQVGLKSYFVYNTSIEWVNADNYCQSRASELALATVETTEEYNFLSQAYEPGIFSNRYWVAARDALTLSQLNWGTTNDTGAEITVDLPVWCCHTINTCGAISPWDSRKAVLEMMPCREFFTEGVLCELKENPTTEINDK